MELAADQVNARGGVLGGRMLQIEFRDTGTHPPTAEVAARELLDMKVPVVIGAGASPVTLQLAPLFNREQVVLMSPSSSSPKLTTEGGDWFFRVYPSDVIEAYRMASFCRDNVIARVAVISVKDTFGEGATDEFVRKYEAATREVVYRKQYTGRLDEQAARKIVDEMAQGKPEAVYIAAYIDDMAVLLEAIDRKGLKVVRLGTSAVTRELIEKAGDAAEGLVFPSPEFDPSASSNPDVARFVQAYKQKWGEAPDTFSVKGYDAVSVIAQAMDIARLPQPKNIRDALLTSEFDGVSGSIQFNLRGDVTETPRLYVVYQGDIVEYDQYRDAEVSKTILAR
jgi:branched-chain amino acid transport system substrate-binding protein